MDTTIFSALIPDAQPTTHAAIARALQRFGSGTIEFVTSHGTTIRPLRISERYDSASSALRRMEVHVDDWQAPPAGLFVVEERCIYLRSRSPMTVAHEFGHALDCALGNGVYLSSTDPSVRSYFTSAREFVTPYAATGLDEYFAEASRCWVEVSDATSLWPRATRSRLHRCDSQMFDYIEDVFKNLES